MAIHLQDHQSRTETACQWPHSISRNAYVSPIDISVIVRATLVHTGYTTYGYALTTVHIRIVHLFINNSLDPLHKSNLFIDN